MNNAARLSCWATVVGTAVEIIATLGAAIVAPGKLDPKTAQSVAYRMWMLLVFFSLVAATLDSWLAVKERECPLNRQ
jgi:hypothetical protein